MTSKRLKDKKVPNLRFPEFTEEWETKKLGEIGEKVNSKNKTNEVNLVFSNSAVQGIVLQNEYFDKSIANKDNLTEYYIVKPFDFVYNPRISSNAKVGAMSVNKTEKTGVVSPLYTVFRINSNLINNSFLEIMFKSKVWHNYMRSIANYGARDDRMNIKGEDFFALPIKAPLYKEQVKIANFLSLIDERIQTQNKIIEELETLKTNISKKIFSQKLRFKNNNRGKFPEWMNKKFREIATITMGQSPESTSYNIEGIGLPLIQGNADIVNRLSAPRQYTKNPTKQCDIGDVLLTVRAPVGYVSKSFHNACIGRGICSVKNNKHSTNEFIYQFLLYFENKWKSLEQGSTFTSVNSSDIGSIIIKVPCVEEQIKISKFLFSIDSKINIEIQLLQKLEEQKKYLLNNLFV